jgi:hypothetical protein
MLRFLRQTTDLKKHADKIQARIRAINDGTETIRSDKEGHCSGG